MLPYQPKNVLVHVLNMAQSKQRWNHMIRHLQHHHIYPTRIDAVNGKQLSSEKIKQHYHQEANHTSYFSPLTLPEIGCFLSHRKSMQLFLDHKASDHLLLFEDDIQIDHSFMQYLRQWQQLLGSQQPKLLKLYTKRPVCGPTIYSYQNIEIIRPNKVPLGAVAQLLNRPAAKKFLESTNQFFQPIDVFYQFWWQHDIDILCTRTSMISEVSRLIGGSTITNKCHNNSPHIKVKIQKELSRFWFRTKLNIASHIHRTLQAWRIQQSSQN